MQKQQDVSAEAAAAFGRLGGQSRSPKKRAAARKNVERARRRRAELRRLEKKTA